MPPNTGAYAVAFTFAVLLAVSLVIAACGGAGQEPAQEPQQPSGDGDGGQATQPSGPTQVTIAQFHDKISFEGGQTLTCLKGEALYYIPGKDAGRLECRPQKPARDCNERSLLRRFGAGIKVLTMVYTEKYTAYRESSHESSSVAMSLDGGVGGIAY